MSDALPPFTADGVLLVGDYPLTLAELHQSHLVTGQGNPSQTWDSAWRGQLVANLAVMAAQLWAVGITDIFIDGSFVENRDRPGDIDGYFVIEPTRLAGRQLEYDLNRLDPHQIWTWDGRRRVVPPTGGKAQLPMRLQYRVELFPHFPGLYAGILDEFGNEVEFPPSFANPARLRQKA